MTATYTKTWTEERDDGSTYPVSADVTREIGKAFADVEKYKTQLVETQKALADIKSRRYWEEIKMVTDERTGMSAVTLVTYKWQAENMRIDFTNEMYRGFGY